MSQKWNLQDIRPAQPRRPRRPSVEAITQRTDYAPATDVDLSRDIASIPIEDGRVARSHRITYAIIACVAVIGGAIFLSASLGKTEIIVFPEVREPNVNAEFTAYPEPRDGELSYEIMTLEATGERQVTATGQTQVEEQATGRIEIRKSTPGAERLIKNTRFRSPSGLIFRIQESIVVPGAITDASGATVPGTIQAEVFADAVGQEYNLPAGTTFDVPGFQESGFSALYNAISAVSVTDFTGGFNGPRFQIDEGELATARQALQAELRNQLIARVETEQPAGFIAFPGAVSITYNQLPAVEYGGNLVTIREQAVLQIPLFEQIAFGSYLADKTIATYDGGDVRVEDPSTLSFAYTSATTSSSVIANEPSLQFSLSGRPQLVWEYDAEAFKADVAGLPKSAINNAISAYPGIEAVRVHMTPFWQQSFPEDVEEITIVEELTVKNE